MKTLTQALAALVLAVAPAFAADPENTLVIEVAGQANGTVEIELLPDVAPQHVARIRALSGSSGLVDICSPRRPKSKVPPGR